MTPAERTSPEIEAPGSREKQKRLKLDRSTKLGNVLLALVERRHDGLNRFDAMRLCHDSVLPSTISSLFHEYGIEFDREFERIPGHAGSVVDVVRYRLTDKGYADAVRLLGLHEKAATAPSCGAQEALI